MVKYKIVITQIITEEREVEAKDFNELQAKLEDQQEFIGRCVKPSTTTELSGTIYTEDGRSIDKVIFD